MTAKNPYEPFRVYRADVSYFSGKIEAYLRYKEIPHQLVEASQRVMRDQVLPATGLMKVPVIEAANGQWLKDTTPMIFWFDQHYAASEVVPKDPVLRFLSCLIEDYADEWLWRPALYYRWMFPNSRHLLGSRISKEVLNEMPVPTAMGASYFARRQIKMHVTGDGVRDHNRAHVEGTYLKLLDCMEGLLTTQPFMLGDRPSLMDFGLFASMFRHFALDPESARIMRDRAPGVYEWVARVWNAKASRFDGPPQWSGFKQTEWQYLFSELKNVYLPYLKANAEAWQRGDKRFDFECEDALYPQLVPSHYRVWCRQQLQREWLRLNADQQAEVRAILGDQVDAIAVLNDGVIEAQLDQEFVLPIERKYPPVKGWEKLKLFVAGTPRDMPEYMQQRSEIER